MPIITKPGAYPGISNEDYHGNPDLLPGPSLSSSGAKKLLGSSPYHFWHSSPLNPNPPADDDKSFLNIGKLAHDLILLPENWTDRYHATPEGYHPNHKKWAEAKAQREQAEKDGKVILRHDDLLTAKAVVAALEANDLAMSLLSDGVSEETLAWQDEETGVWLRARPDFRPNAVTEQANVAVVSDLKFMAPTFCSPSGFSRAIDNFGYHMSAAFYFDGIERIFGTRPSTWMHIVVEKDQPHTVSLYALPLEDIAIGAKQNREAIRKFADCLERDEWPAYADQPVSVGLPEYARKRAA